MAAEIGKAREREGGRLGNRKSWSWSLDWEPLVLHQVWSEARVLVEANLALRPSVWSGEALNGQAAFGEGRRSTSLVATE